MRQLIHNSNSKIPNSEFRIPNSRRSRSGISIIEVMTAVVVAMIGVFGTLVLIPFAVKQAQSGLDLDDGRNLAINSAATMQAMGFLQQDRLIFGVTDFSNPATGGTQHDRVTTIETWPILSSSLSAAPVMVDPIWINANTVDRTGMDAVGIGVISAVPLNFGFFGYGPDATDPADPPNLLRGQVYPPLPTELRGILRASLSMTDDPVLGPPGATIASRDPSPSLMTNQQLQRVVQSSDDLVFDTFGTDDDVLAGQPFQVFDRDATGNILRRQSAGGRLSTAVFLIPAGGLHRRVTLVFSDRTPQLYANPGGPRDISNVNARAIMASVLVTTRGALPGDLPSGLHSAGSEVVICPVDWVANSPPEPSHDYVDVVGTPDVPGVRRDDWVMMINQLPAGYPVAGTANRLQISFYRVTNVDEGEGIPSTPTAPGNLASLTLDGSDFDFGPNGTTDMNGLGIPFPRSSTYIVHLRDVVNVYEDTISL